ncbi:cadherin-like domain-containing protein [Mycolicibacterium aichiense]|nr:cadherin-like domain-containing protein [Mycolicibacterium aichiense]MCV7021087.1 tandem-95 repeat protein [Mycolicibacterium aichiense]STZ24993.1 YVTN beta-propeller repeat-containing protein [Mycolicibacterium aichiense]
MATTPDVSGSPTVRRTVSPDGFGKVVSGVFNSIGLGQLPTDLPSPTIPLGPLFATLSGAAREVELLSNSRHTPTGSISAGALSTEETEDAVDNSATAAHSANDAASDAEAARERSQAELNKSLGWVPVLGTAFNAFNFVADFVDFARAALRGDTADMSDEINDMTVDLVGMIPVVGGPLAAMIHQTLVVGPVVGHAPAPVNDSFTTDEDTPLAGNVLTNDTDADGDVLTAALSKQAAHGAVVLDQDGTFTYAPVGDYNGVDTFTYTVSDGVNIKTATVTVTVRPVSDAPIAKDDTVTLNEDTSKIIAVLANDTDVDRDPLSVLATTIPQHGEVSVGTGGAITYTPVGDYNGADSFAYTVTDGHGGTSTATVSITVTPVNDAPIAVTDNVATDEDTALTSNVLTNDQDIDGDALGATLSTQVAHGTLIFNVDGSYTYTPNADYNGVDSFTYSVSDGVKTSTANVNITVNPVNDAPVPGNDSTALDEDSSTVIAVLGNDSDVEHDPLSVVGTSTPGHGTIAVGDGGTITYTPSANYNGADSFTYTVSDGNGGNTVATVSVTVNPVNDAPVANTDNYGVDQDKQLTGNVRNNDTDVDGDALTVGFVSGPSHGSLTLNPDGSFTYNPAGGYNGGDNFTYTVTDGSGASATGTANITVNYVAPPVTTPTLSQKVGTFVGNTRGRTIANPDGSYAGECVSLVRQYLEQVFNIRTGAWGNAIDYRSGGSGGNQLAARGFTWHTDRNFQDGDILVFGQNSQAGTTAYGHIGIWYGGQFYDQNDGWRANARTANYSPFSGVSPALLGYWRASGSSNPQYATAKVMARTQRMAAATLNSQQLGWYEVNTNLSLVCYARGQAVKGYYSSSFSGGLDNLWYKTSDGGYAADVDISTGSNNPVTGSC